MGILQSIQQIFKSTPEKEKRNINYLTSFGANTAITPQKALTFSAVWAAMRLLSESVSSLPLGVYRSEKNGDRIELKDANLTYLLKYQPNSYQNKITFLDKIMFGKKLKNFMQI